MAESDIKKLPLKNILISSLRYCLADRKKSLSFIIIAYALGAMALLSWKSLLFWPVLFLMYVAWGTFFRYYFNKKPYINWHSLLNSMVPSTKIEVLAVVIGTILIVLPFVPLFLSSYSEFNEKYSMFLQGDIEHVGMLVLIANIMFMMVSPMIAYRPFLAWISALLGMSGSLRFAWNKTKGNYVEFLLIAIISYLSVAIVRWGILLFGGNDYVTLLWGAPVVVYFNVLSAKTYEFFFLDIE